MKTYLAYFKLRFITSLQYRAAALAGMSTQIFFGFIYIFLYQALYNAGTNDIPFSKIVNYIWLSQALLALINQMSVDSEMTTMIVNGDLSYELLRPKELYFMWFSKIVAQRISSVILRCIPMFILTIFVLKSPYNLTGPENIYYFLLFILSLILGTILVTSLALFAPIICMKTLNEKGFVSIYMVISNLFSGVEFPTYFFPKVIKQISNILPFQYVSDLPFQLYNGTVTYYNGFIGIIVQLVWIIIIMVLGYFLTNKFLKKAVIQGG